MSRSHTASKSGRSRQQVDNAEGYIEQAKNIVTLLGDVISSRPQEWETYLPSARSAMNALDRLHFFRDPGRFQEQIWLIQGLQDFGFHDPDNGTIQDIVEWSQTAWLKVLRNYPDNIECLYGLGQNWLQRSQTILARIHEEEGSSASSGGSNPKADARKQGPLYVEARGYLQPSVDFFTRAVRAADRANGITGDLLASAAESQMSLGNVTGPTADEQHFTHAVRHLRRAAQIPGYSLSTYFQQYLEDYGRYVS